MTKRKAKLHPRAVTIIQRYFPEVTQVVDATESSEIHVTSSDVRASKKKEHSQCALAVACKRQEKADGVVVSISRLYVVQGSVATRYEIDEAAGREITSFDRGGSFEPGTYTLRPVTESHILRKQKKPQGNLTGERKRIAKRHITENIRTNL